MSKAPLVLLVNPWITDFSAFDLWARPLGLLHLGGLLRDGGCGVHFIDCTDRHDAATNGHPDVKTGKERPYGTGKLPRMSIATPEAYKGTRRRYHRHGIHPESLRARLRDTPRPDLVWVTSIMTYWYPGVRETVALVREVFPDVPVWLGGIYARLCPDHAARTPGVDEVITLEEAELPAKIEAATGFSVSNREAWGRFDAAPLPVLDLLWRLDHAPILTSRGCPFSCPYCASRLLQPTFERKSPEAVFGEVAHWHERFGIRDFAFYDDALLMGAERSLRPALERVVREGLRVRFHTPNAMHVGALDDAWCGLLFESGFKTVRLGFETARRSRQAEWGGKTNTDQFAEAVARLLRAGFTRRRIGVYLLCGVPGQTVEEVEESIEVVTECGADPYLCEYSPIPGTALWREAVRLSAHDLEAEPLYHNNTFFACARPEFTREDVQHLKLKVKAARESRDNGVEPTSASGFPPVSG